MAIITQQKLLGALHQEIHPLDKYALDYTALSSALQCASVVMIGEASHGTHEFYQHRAEITKQLILHQGFDAVVIEGDWPYAYVVNNWVVEGRTSTLDQALGGFKKFPTWMWRNTVTYNFLNWLQTYNQQQEISHQVGFYGLDLYSLHASARTIIDGLAPVDSSMADSARHAYACFEWGEEEPQAYGYAVAKGLNTPCNQLVNEQYLALNPNFLMKVT